MTRDPILIVDDNPANLKLARVVLQREGYEVHTATDATETLAALAVAVPRLILMDLQLPGMDGLALTRRIREETRFREVRIVALTANAMLGDREKALAAGCDGYLSKPIDLRTFPAAVEAFLDGRAIHREEPG